jgi:hypothetical protein
MAATRRKGKWSGGTPVLGYDLDPRGRRLHVNDQEAQRVRAIFALYLEHQSLLPVVQELARRGWVGKRWQTRHGRPRGGRPFDKTSLYRLLTNVLYAGKVRYKDEVHDGEQPALIDADTFGRVQALLRSHGPDVGPPGRQRLTALLKGLLRCVCCDCAMTPSHTTRKGGLRYRYYTCVHAQKSGWQSCPSKSIPAQPIEQLVVEQIQRLGRDPLVLQQLLTTVRQQDEARLAEWEEERVGLERDLLRGQGEVRRLLAEVGAGDADGRVLSRLAQLQERVGHIEQRIVRLRTQRETIQQEKERLTRGALRSGADLSPRQLTRDAERINSRRLSFLATCPRPFASFGPRARPPPCTHERRRHLPQTGPLPLPCPPPVAANSPSRCLTAQTRSSRPAPLPLGNLRAETLRGGSRGPRHERARITMARIMSGSVSGEADACESRFRRRGGTAFGAGSTPQVRRKYAAPRAAVSRPASASWPRFPTPNASSRCPTPSHLCLPATTPASPPFLPADAPPRPFSSPMRRRRHTRGRIAALSGPAQRGPHAAWRANPRGEAARGALDRVRRLSRSKG